MAPKLVTAPTTEPVSLEEAKAHLRIDSTTEDALITRLIRAAKQKAEFFTGRVFITQTWDCFLDIPKKAVIRVPLPPLQSVSSVKYTQKDGTTSVFASTNYVVDVKSEPGRVALKKGQTWPTDLQEINGMEIQFVAGYGAATAVPEAIKQAILLLVAHWFNNREAIGLGQIGHEVPMGPKELLLPYRIYYL